MIRFIGQQGMNMYIYAPKDDPYHREKWREDYPQSMQNNLVDLIQEAKRNKVAFVFAISPGLDIRFNGDEGKADLAALIHKFDTVYNMGVRNFAIFFDDIHNTDGRKQAYVLNEVNRKFVHVRPGVAPLLVVPTQYNLAGSMYKKGKLQSYTEIFSKQLDSDIIVLYTGQGVVCDGITAEDMRTVEGIYGPRVGVWWNYPVSDYEKEKLALGPIHGLDGDAASYMKLIVYNPMQFAKMSHIALETGAAYAKSPLTYNDDLAWNQAIDNQYGALAPDMKIFALHSQRMGDTTTRWARCGREDAPLVRQHMDAFWQAAGTPAGSREQRLVLQKDFVAMEQASQNLQAKLPADIKKECLPQLQQLDKLGQYDQQVLDMVEAVEAGRSAYGQFLYHRISRKKASLEGPQRALVSDKVGKAFVSEGVQWYEGKAANKS
jgi:hyaluronoglucosaminidase